MKKVLNYILDYKIHPDGATFVSMNTSTNKAVAIKEIPASESCMLTEAGYNFIKSIKSKRLAKVYEVFKTENNYYIVYKNYRSSLQSLISARRPLSEGVIRRWVVEILKGLTDLHFYGIPHGNLKPSNILLSTDDLEGEAILTDYGQYGENLFEDITQLGSILNELITLGRPAGALNKAKDFAQICLESNMNVFELSQLDYVKIEKKRMLVDKNNSDKKVFLNTQSIRLTRDTFQESMILEDLGLLEQHRDEDSVREKILQSAYDLKFFVQLLEYCKRIFISNLDYFLVLHLQQKLIRAVTTVEKFYNLCDEEAKHMAVEVRNSAIDIVNKSGTFTNRDEIKNFVVTVFNIIKYEVLKIKENRSKDFLTVILDVCSQMFPNDFQITTISKGLRSKVEMG